MKIDRNIDTNVEIREILGRIPGWGLRWGNTAILFALLLLLSLAWLIKYPDVVEARVLIITDNPPLRLVAPQSIRMMKLRVKPQQQVKAGEIVAEFENTADIADIDQLRAWFDKAQQDKNFLLDSLPLSLNVGPLQGKYARLVQLINDYQFYVTQGEVEERVRLLNKQVEYLSELNQTLENQLTILKREVKLANDDYERTLQLYQDGKNVSKKQLENTETFYLQYKRQLDAVKANQLRNRIQIEKLNGDVVELEQQQNFGNHERWLDIMRLTKDLGDDLAQWEQNYLLITPIAGEVVINRPIVEGQFMEEGQLVLAILPNEAKGKTMCRGYLTATRSGKAKAGMDVNIFLDAYPYHEYGILKGTLNEIALLPEQDQYLVEILLPDTLITTYQLPIPLEQEQSGRAEIITEDRRLLSRLMDRLTSLMKNN